MSDLLTLHEAWARLLALAPAPPVTRSGARDPLHGFLSEDLIARRTQPPADLSAMDGYAVCGDGPWQRVGEARAGLPFGGTLSPGECTRISTGAHMPQGSDRVLIQENASVDGDRVRLAQGESLPDAGRHVRVRGFDFSIGDVVLEKGAFIGPPQRALAIAAGHDAIPHRAAPLTQVLDSGDELSAIASECGPDQIPASNGPMIAAMLHPWVGQVETLGPVPDDMEALAAALAKADGHVLITSGGASVGDHDLIQEALKAWGAKIDFWKVAIKPGKPLMIATRQGHDGPQVILGLPGNPVSSFVTCFLFALPLVRAAMGDPDPLPKTQLCLAGEDLPATGKRREFLRAVLERGEVRLAGSQDSSALRSLAEANCLIDRPAGADPVRAGEAVPVYNLQNG
ncbi:MAG: molybdopterin molybdotransferase MoeA [Pseudomonadota bacterium]